MQINLMQILWQIVNFVILLIILTKLVYRPILKILEERSKKIQAGLQAAEKSLEEQAKAEAKHRHLLAQAEGEAEKILDATRAEAKVTAKDIIATARREAKANADKEYQILRDKLQQEQLKVRHHLVNLVTETTAAVLRTSLTASIHKQIIKKQIQELSKIKH